MRAEGLAKNEVEILFRPQTLEGYRFKVGERYVMFWINKDTGPTLVTWPYGAMLIHQKNLVESSMFNDLKNQMPLDDLIPRIKKSLDDEATK